MSRLCLLHTCGLELLTLTVLCACPLREALGGSHIANSACAPSQGVGMSTVGSPRPFAHRHFGFDNPHALGAGRLSPLSHDSLVAMSCSLINFSSRASSRWVHMDVTFEAHLPLSVSLPSPLGSSPPSPPRLGIDTLSRKYHFSIHTPCSIPQGSVTRSSSLLRYPDT